MRRVLLLAAAAAACGDDLRPLVVDAADVPPPEGFVYKLRVAAAEPPDRPPAAQPPAVFIDGVARSALEVRYPDQSSALGDVHVVELRAGSTVVAQHTLVIDREGCLFRFDRADLLQQDLCGYDSGDLRFASERATQAELTCFGDAFCFPRCFGNEACSGAQPRCTSRITGTSPLASHLACAPAGPRGLGEACTLIADPDGAYDDCGLDLLCVGGTCRATCSPRDAVPTCAGCAYVPGHAPEIGVCPTEI